VGLLQWLRAKDQATGGMVGMGLSEIDGFFIGAHRRAKDDLKSMTFQRNDADAGAPPFTVDLDRGIAVVRRRRRDRSGRTP
jgi:hypothetical protein